MRLYAFLLVAGAALCARAASIPVAETEKKLIDIVPDNLDKLPENTSSEQELIDQANTINDVDNKLRSKPEDIPVEVIVENAQPLLKIDEEQDEEIIRPAPDLRNPGPPQRQEHETQNPEFYASEQNTVTLFKQSLADAQNVLRQGFQGITDGIQHIAATNEPIQTLQLSIQSLRDSFTAQMVKVNATIHSFVNTESASIVNPAVEQIEQGLFKLRNDFNRGVNTLASGVDVVAALKADSEATIASSGSTAPPTGTASTPAQFFTDAVNNLQNQIQTGFQNLQDSINRITQNWNPFNQGSSAAASPAAPAGVQSDSQVAVAPTTAPTNFLQGFQNLFNLGQGQNQGQAPNPAPGTPAQNQGQPGFLGQNPFSQAFNNILNVIQGNRPGSPAQPVLSGQPAQTTPEAAIKPESKPDSQAEPVKPAAVAEAPAQANAVTPSGPIRQILQNNPITKGVASAVQRLQNINNPEKPRGEQTAEQTKNVADDKGDAEPKKGGGPNTGGNNDSSNSGDRVEQQEEVKEEIEKVSEVQKVPEVEKASEDEIKEHKTEEVVDKTE